MQRLAARQSPAVLWYSVPGERIELSGRVLDNWVAKTANLWVDECEVEAGSLVALPERLHWRSLVLALASLRVGAQLAWGGQVGADVRADFDAQTLVGAEAEYLVAVAPEPLAPRFVGQLPIGLLDYAAEVRSHPDVYMGLAEPAASETAWASTTYKQLMQVVGEGSQRLAAALPEGTAAIYCEGEVFSATWLLQALEVLAAGYAVLVLDPTIAWDEARLTRVLGDERAQRYSDLARLTQPGA